MCKWTWVRGLAIFFSTQYCGLCIRHKFQLMGTNILSSGSSPLALLTWNTDLRVVCCPSLPPCLVVCLLSGPSSEGINGICLSRCHSGHSGDVKKKKRRVWERMMRREALKQTHSLGSIHSHSIPLQNLHSPLCHSQIRPRNISPWQTMTDTIPHHNIIQTFWKQWESRELRGNTGS